MKKHILFAVFLLTIENFVFAQLYTGDGGRGIVIAVPPPVMRNTTANDAWMPQLFQDLITGDIARFSAMTVIDRSNEQMVLAEQSLSAGGNYSDNDYIKMGNLTNARFLVAGSIQNISGRYSVSFRINNTETNEIRATFNKTYSLADIETGLAAKETVKELLTGMGVQLTPAGERTLLTIQQVEAKSTAQLARGMNAAKNNNIVDALAFLSDALGSNTTREEANRNIQSFFTTMPTGSITQRANYAMDQKAKWDKIFADIDAYLWKNLPVFIYDFSTVEDRIDVNSKMVRLNIGPGIKIVPNRTALNVQKTVMDNWNQISRRDENRDWASSVRMPTYGNYYFDNSYNYRGRIALYDEYGDRIANYDISFKLDIDFASGIQVIAQHKYYENTNFNQITYNIPLNQITDKMTPKVEQIFIIPDEYRHRHQTAFFKAMSVIEWQQWLASQGR